MEQNLLNRKKKPLNPEETLMFSKHNSNSAQQEGKSYSYILGWSRLLIKRSFVVPRGPIYLKLFGEKTPQVYNVNFHFSGVIILFLTFLMFSLGLSNKFRTECAVTMVNQGCNQHKMCYQDGFKNVCDNPFSIYIVVCMWKWLMRFWS